MAGSEVSLTRGPGTGIGPWWAPGRLRTPLLLAALALVAAAGCRDVAVGEPRDLKVTLEADRAGGTVGDSVVFMYEAEGRALGEIRISFGDGAVDTIGTFGAQTAAGVRSHTYQESGDFQVVAEAEEAAGPIRADTLLFPVEEPLNR